MTPSIEQDAAAHDVTSRSEIRGMLRRILKHHTLVNVTVPEADGEYCSAVLDVLADDGCWLLDELPASEARDKLKPGDTLRVRGRLDGVEFRFKSRVETIEQSKEGGFYKMRLPERLRYEQKRSNYRAPVSAGHSIPVSVHTPAGDELEGELRDISDGGFRVSLTVPGQTEFHCGDVLTECRISISEQEAVCANAEVRYARQLRSARSWSVGARFIGLEPTERRKVRELVAELQRRSMRLMAKN